MRKRVAYILAVSMGVMTLSSCEKVDDIFPEFSLQGGNTLTIPLNKQFVDPGVKAIDDTDGDISNRVVVKSNLDVDKVGQYEIAYLVSDEAGNVSGPLVRKVIVVNESASLEGTYDGGIKHKLPVGDSVVFVAQIVIDSTLNNRLHLLSSLTDDVKDILIDVSGENQLIVPFQQIERDGQPCQIQGAGTFVPDTLLIDATLWQNGAAEYMKYYLFKQQE